MYKEKAYVVDTSDNEETVVSIHELDKIQELIGAKIYGCSMIEETPKFSSYKVLKMDIDLEQAFVVSNLRALVANQSSKRLFFRTVDYFAQARVGIVLVIQFGNGEEFMLKRTGYDSWVEVDNTGTYPGSIEGCLGLLVKMCKGNVNFDVGIRFDRNIRLKFLEGIDSTL